jgi:TRAP transporter TAXI family solute receptor
MHHRLFKIIFGLSAVLLALSLLGLLFWKPLASTHTAAATPLVLQEEEVVPYDLLSDVKDEYALSIRSGLPESEIYIPAQALCVMVDKYVDAMDCHFQYSGDQEGELQLISEAMLLDEVFDTHRYSLSSNKQLQVVTPLYTLAFQCVVRKSSGIRSLNELTGKRVAVGSLGSEAELLTREIFKSQSLDEDSFIPIYMDMPEAALAMEKGLIDCIAVHSSVPSPFIARLASNFDIALLPLDQGRLNDRLSELLPGYEMVTIPNQTYKGMDSYILTAATKVMLATVRDTKMVITYEVTKALYDHMPEFKSIFAADREIKGDQLNDRSAVSFHQGATKYFWERDLIWK